MWRGETPEGSGEVPGIKISWKLVGDRLDRALPWVLAWLYLFQLCD